MASKHSAHKSALAKSMPYPKNQSSLNLEPDANFPPPHKIEVKKQVRKLLAKEVTHELGEIGKQLSKALKEVKDIKMKLYLTDVMKLKNSVKNGHGDQTTQDEELRVRLIRQLTSIENSLTVAHVNGLHAAASIIVDTPLDPSTKNLTTDSMFDWSSALLSTSASWQ